MKKKNKKLLFQVSVIILPVFFAMAAAVTLTMYNSTVNGFLDAQKAHMEFLLNNEMNVKIFVTEDEMEWYLTRWCDYPDDMLKEYPEDYDTELYDSYADEDDAFSRAWRERLPDDLKAYNANLQYNNFSAYLGTAFDFNSYDRFIVMSASEKTEGMVIYDYSHDGNGKKAGEYFDLDLDKHPALKEAIGSGTEDITYEKTNDFPKKGNYYVGYQPIVCNGKTMAVVAIVYNWNSLNKTMMTSLKRTLFISIGFMILTLVILQTVIYCKSIAPVTKIQKIVREYAETKDSSAVIESISAIKAQNEFGKLSEDIADLAVKMDKYTKENARLTGERERVAAELDMARNIQAGQLPSTFPAFPDRSEFDIYATMTPAKEVGGDFYDFFFVDDDHLALVIADVSGKGVPAALFMMMSKMLINNYAMMGLSPADVLTRTNEAICKNNRQKMFVTVWLGILEISTGRVTAANAGHEYPIIRQPGGSFELFKEKHGFVIGGIKGKKYKQYEFTLQKGGTLFVYTDGVPEATAADEEMFGTERLVNVLDKTPGAAPRTLLGNVHDEVDRFVGDAPQFDDLTMLCIKLL